VKKLMGLFICLQIPFFSNAQELYLGGTLGFSVLNELGSSGDKYDSELAYGLRGGFVLTENLSGGLMLQRMSTRDGAGPELTALNVLGEFTYHFGGTVGNGFLLNGLVGVTQLETDDLFSRFSQGQSALTGGVGLGYQFMINPNFSFSPQVTYMYVSDANESDFSQTSVLMNVAFWY